MGEMQNTQRRICLNLNVNNYTIVAARIPLSRIKDLYLLRNDLYFRESCKSNYLVKI